MKRKKRIKILKGLHIGKRLIKWSKKREYYNNKTFKKDKNVSPNLPSFFSIEGKTVYAIIYPTDIGQFIDNDLITNKNILQTIKEDDNPYIIKYELKL